ncbi:MAG: pyridoxine 5'-phosphate synthase [Saprospiraceae bacterium]|nr:pyridoxine 5'-phosphate synthase [Saprospiraceae bacterium]
MKTRLSVNINKIALLRNSRGGNLPDLVQMAKDCEKFGAEGITVHPRPDERHIRYSDIPPLRKVVQTEFNIEGYPSESFIDLVLSNRPDQVTLVPDPPDVLTSNTGWDPVQNEVFLRDCIVVFKNAGIRVSLFLNPVEEFVPAVASIGADRIELYTGNYSQEFFSNPEQAIKDHVATALAAEAHNIGLNAGHDLNLFNLGYYKSKIPNLLEVSIGHALIADALYFGLENVIGMYKQKLVDDYNNSYERR